MARQANSKNWFSSRAAFVFLGFMAITGFFLWEEHKAHILGFLPYVLLLLCPLLHLFMHGGHGGNHRSGQGSDKT